MDRDDIIILAEKFINSSPNNYIADNVALPMPYQVTAEKILRFVVNSWIKYGKSISPGMDVENVKLVYLVKMESQ